MASGSFEQVDVLCPFYKNDGIQRIVCEGLVSDSSITLTYMNKVDCKRQKKVFCCKNYKKCEVYRMLMCCKYDEGVLEGDIK